MAEDPHMMPKNGRNMLQDGRDMLREAAFHQGEAYRHYGEALEQYSAGEISAGDLFKTAGDLYFKEIGRLGAHLFEIETSMVTRILGGHNRPAASSAKK